MIDGLKQPVVGHDYKLYDVVLHFSLSDKPVSRWVRTEEQNHQNTDMLKLQLRTQAASQENGILKKQVLFRTKSAVKYLFVKQHKIPYPGRSSLRDGVILK